MNTRDELLSRVTEANPFPSEAELPDDVFDGRPPLGLLIGKEDAPSSLSGLVRSAPGERRRRGLLVAAGTAVAVLAVVAVSIGVVTLIGRSPSEEAATSGINSVSDIAVTPQGTLYALSGGGISVWETEEGRLQGLLPLTGLPGAGDADNPSLEVHHIEVAPDGTLWAAGVTATAAAARAEDASRGWIARFDGSQWSVPVSSSEIAPGVEIPVFAEVADLVSGPEWISGDASGSGQVGGSIWALADQRLIFFDGAMWWDYGVPTRSTSLDVGANGEVWLGSDDGEGPWQFGGGAFPWERLFSDEPGEGDIILPTMLTHQVAVSESGWVWMATDDGTGIIRLSGRAVELFTTDDGLLSNSGSVVAGPGDTVVVVHENGVSELRGNQWTTFELDLSNAIGSRAVLDPEGVLWIPSDSGIVRFDGTDATSLAVTGADSDVIGIGEIVE